MIEKANNHGVYNSKTTDTPIEGKSDLLGIPLARTLRFDRL